MNEPYMHLAAAIIELAINDWQIGRLLYKPYRVRVGTDIEFWLYEHCEKLREQHIYFNCPRDELITFFNSDWCTFLVESLGSQKHFIFERHTVPMVAYD